MTTARCCMYMCLQHTLPVIPSTQRHSTRGDAKKWRRASPDDAAVSSRERGRGPGHRKKLTGSDVLRIGRKTQRTCAKPPGHSATAHDAKPLATRTSDALAHIHIPANKHVPGRTNTLFREGLDKAGNLVLFKVWEIPVDHGISVRLVSACNLQPPLASGAQPGHTYGQDTNC